MVESLSIRHFAEFQLFLRSIAVNILHILHFQNIHHWLSLFHSYIYIIYIHIIYTHYNIGMEAFSIFSISYPFSYGYPSPGPSIQFVPHLQMSPLITITGK